MSVLQKFCCWRRDSLVPHFVAYTETDGQECPSSRSFVVGGGRLVRSWEVLSFFTLHISSSSAPLSRRTLHG
mgnify:CR=1 FL=1